LKVSQRRNVICGFIVLDSPRLLGAGDLLQLANAAGVSRRSPPGEPDEQENRDCRSDNNDGSLLRHGRRFLATPLTRKIFLLSSH